VSARSACGCIQVVMSTLSPVSQVSLNVNGLACPLCVCTEVRLISECTGKSLWRCPGCDVTFLYPHPPLQEYAAHFQTASLTTDELKGKFEDNRARVLACVADAIHRRRREGSILDVGCATGVFLRRHFASGWDRWGVDLSPTAAECAAGDGIQVHSGNLRSADFPDQRFDVITVLDAFYYFREPQTDLAEISRLLKDHGLLALELPLATSRIWRSSSPIGKLLSGSRRPLLSSSDHLYYFTPKSVIALLRRCGFVVDVVLPLPGNRQRSVGRDIGMFCYYQLSLILKTISRSRIFLAPRFLVLARKDSTNLNLKSATHSH
jgi:SAM-dependent methyltransferase